MRDESTNQFGRIGVTPTAGHPDAVGYLTDLSVELDKPWFTMITDLTISGIDTVDQLSLDNLVSLFAGRASYIGISSARTSGTAAAAQTAVPSDHLEKLSGFSNFKRLEDGLQISLEKRITLVFGTNGSGKSSLCESLKVLANPGSPSRPLHDVRATGPTTPAFRYKFTSDTADQTWTSSVG